MYNPPDIFGTEFMEAGCLPRKSEIFTCTPLINITGCLASVDCRSLQWTLPCGLKSTSFEVFVPVFVILQIESHCPMSLGRLSSSLSGFANIKLIAFLPLKQGEWCFFGGGFSQFPAAVPAVWSWKAPPALQPSPKLFTEVLWEVNSISNNFPNTQIFLKHVY